ncbi:hypothetical protein BDP55DRAFT_741286 [Colletotrichum godetiae]|uniref:TAM domain methyltransferase n=1 Tax=Colletotrichum godetiae TaxID=1209918 RepID=A0AAJ0EZ33_9PEZI|nr:uncharacterized protein BDP55DRAFT_741286 [Colletotrichum godetiae]KAK1676810.1 hypothetical protein BDP55DRAFT_741286 [Colletotrichum godetiae]
MPNDEPEMDRMDMCHAMMTRVIGNRIFLAPLERSKTHRILDVGTGTGIWAIEMGDLFAEVIGIDLSAIQPTWVPENVKFQVDDVESPWIEVRKYDFISTGFLAASIRDWNQTFVETMENLGIPLPRSKTRRLGSRTKIRKHVPSKNQKSTWPVAQRSTV